MASGKIDLVNDTTEEIYQKLRRAEVHPLVAEVIVQIHEQQLELQRATNDLVTLYSDMLNALKLSHQLHKQHTDRVNKLIGKYSDQDRDLIKSEEPN